MEDALDNTPSISTPYGQLFGNPYHVSPSHLEAVPSGMRDFSHPGGVVRNSSMRAPARQFGNRGGWREINRYSGRSSGAMISSPSRGGRKRPASHAVQETRRKRSISAESAASSDVHTAAGPVADRREDESDFVLGEPCPEGDPRGSGKAIQDMEQLSRRPRDRATCVVPGGSSERNKFQSRDGEEQAVPLPEGSNAPGSLLGFAVSDHMRAMFREQGVDVGATVPFQQHADGVGPGGTFSAQSVPLGKEKQDLGVTQVNGVPLVRGGRRKEDEQRSERKMEEEEEEEDELAFALPRSAHESMIPYQSAELESTLLISERRIVPTNGSPSVWTPACVRGDECVGKVSSPIWRVPGTPPQGFRMVMWMTEYEWVRLCDEGRVPAARRPCVLCSRVEVARKMIHTRSRMASAPRDGFYNEFYNTCGEPGGYRSECCVKPYQVGNCGVVGTVAAYLPRMLRAVQEGCQDGHPLYRVDQRPMLYNPDVARVRKGIFRSPVLQTETSKQCSLDAPVSQTKFSVPDLEILDAREKHRDPEIDELVDAEVIPHSDEEKTQNKGARNF